MRIILIYVVNLSYYTVTRVSKITTSIPPGKKFPPIHSQHLPKVQRTSFKHLYKHQIHKSSTENSNPYPRKIDDIPIPRKIDEIHRNIVSAYFKWGFGIIFGDRKFMFSSLLRNWCPMPANVVQTNPSLKELTVGGPRSSQPTSQVLINERLIMCRSTFSGKDPL